jgi:pimeloyl-ACP methyl ester carboxylesterase
MGFDSSEEMSVEGQAFVDFLQLVRQHYVGRTKPIPTFSDQMLRRLTMPVMALVGGKDAVLDSDETKRRLEACVPRAQVEYLAEAGHGLIDSTSSVLEFLLAV